MENRLWWGCSFHPLSCSPLPCCVTTRWHAATSRGCILLHQSLYQIKLYYSAPVNVIDTCKILLYLSMFPLKINFKLYNVIFLPMRLGTIGVFFQHSTYQELLVGPPNNQPSFSRHGSPCTKLSWTPPWVGIPAASHKCPVMPRAMSYTWKGFSGPDPAQVYSMKLYAWIYMYNGYTCIYICTHLRDASSKITTCYICFL